MIHFSDGIPLFIVAAPSLQNIRKVKKREKIVQKPFSPPILSTYRYRPRLSTKKILPIFPPPVRIIGTYYASVKSPFDAY